MLVPDAAVNATADPSGVVRLAVTAAHAGVMTVAARAAAPVNAAKVLVVRLISVFSSYMRWM